MRNLKKMSSLEWFSNTVLLTIQYPPHEHVFCMLVTGRQTVFTRTHHQHSATLYLLYDEHKESPCAGLEEKKSFILYSGKNGFAGHSINFYFLFSNHFRCE